MDAWSVKHNRRVVLKQIHRDADGDNEIRIMSYLSQDTLSGDPDNHCIPLLDVLDPGDSYDFVLIVMPLLLNLRHIKFLTIDEAMEFCSQILQVRSRLPYFVQQSDPRISGPYVHARA